MSFASDDQDGGGDRGWLRRIAAADVKKAQAIGGPPQQASEDM